MHLELLRQKLCDSNKSHLQTFKSNVFQKLKDNILFEVF